MKKEISPKLVALIFGVLVMVFAIGFYVFSWTGPTQIPPEGNVDAPINVGSTAQTKTGGLTVEGLTVSNATSCDTIDTDASGVVSCGTDAVNDEIASCTNVNTCTITAEEVVCSGCVTSTDIGTIGACSNICTDADTTYNYPPNSCSAGSSIRVINADGTVTCETKTADNEVYGLMLAGTLVARPAAGTSGRVYWATDEDRFYRDNGTAWEEIIRGAVSTEIDSDITTHAADASAHHTKTTSFADITDRAGASKLNWGLNKLLKGAGAGSDPTEIDVPSAIGLEATVAMFQVNSATGTFCLNAAELNNNTYPDAGPGPTADGVGQYAEVNFGKVVFIKRWRQYGNTDNNGDGEWKIQYYDLSAHAWTDWVTGIATRVAESWTSYSTETEVLTDKIRIVATSLDSKGYQRIDELEVIY